jgi:hypothetical protein
MTSHCYLQLRALKLARLASDIRGSSGFHRQRIPVRNATPIVTELENLASRSPVRSDAGQVISALMFLPAVVEFAIAVHPPVRTYAPAGEQGPRQLRRSAGWSNRGLPEGNRCEHPE